MGELLGIALVFFDFLNFIWRKNNILIGALADFVEGGAVATTAGKGWQGEQAILVKRGCWFFTHLIYIFVGIGTIDRQWMYAGEEHKILWFFPKCIGWCRFAGMTANHDCHPGSGDNSNYDACLSIMTKICE